MASIPLTLQISAVSAEYGGRRVFTGLDLTLHHGQTLVVAGHNGSGKSTLLRILAGAQRPSSGSVRLAYAGTQRAPQDARHLIGLVAPDLMLYRELTALENLRFFAAVRGLRRSDAELTTLLDQVGLPGRGGDLLSAYSSGMTQRLRYACALLHAPPLLLLDEPTVTLDERGAAVVDALVLQQRHHGICVIATNDQRELRHGDYVLRLAPE